MAYEYFSKIQNQNKYKIKDVYSNIEFEGRDTFLTYAESIEKKHSIKFKFNDLFEHTFEHDALFEIEGNGLYLVFYSADKIHRDLLIKIIEECFLSLGNKIIFREED